MRSSRDWTRVLGIEPGEGRPVVLFVLFSFFLGIAFNFVQTATFTLFLSYFTAQTLSYVYIINAVVITALTALYLRIGRRLAFRRLLQANLGFLGGLVAIFWIALLIFKAEWIIFLLPVLFQILTNFGLLAFWPLANRLFNLRQGKRLFGLIGSGQWIAIVASGLLMGPLSASLGIQNLLGLGLAGAIGAMAMLRVISRANRDALAKAEEQPEAPRTKAPAEKRTPLWRDPYILTIFGLVAMWWVAFFLVDNLYYDRAAAQFPDPARLAGFIGLFLSGLGFLALVMSFALAGRIVSHFGLRVSLLVLPGLLAAAAALMAFGGSLGAGAALLFWMAISAKLLDSVFGFSVDRSLQVLLYQPFPAAQRSQVQTIAEGAIQPFANGLAGVILLVLGAIFRVVTLPLIFSLLVVSMAWFAFAYSLGKEYPRRLLDAIRKRRFDPAALNLAEPATLQTLRQGLADPHPGPVIYAANLLEEFNQRSLVEAVPGLLSHRSPEVRQNTYERVERLKLEDVLPQLRAALAIETFPAARRAGTRTLLSFGQAEDLAGAAKYLGHPLAEVRLGAIVGLMRAGGLEGVLMAGGRLLELARSNDAAERIQACQALGEIGMQQYVLPLMTLLEDSDAGVRQAGLRAAGQVKSPSLWQLVISALYDQRVRASAAAALAAGGNAALPQVSGAFELASTPPWLRRQLAGICGQIRSPQAIAWLHSQMDFPDLVVRGQVLSGLYRAGYRVPPAELSSWIERLRKEAAFNAWLLAALLDLAENEDCRLVQAGLKAELARSRERIFELLGCCRDRQALEQARQGLGHPSPDQRAYSLEIVDNALPQELKALLIPLLDDSTPEQRLKRLTGHFPIRRLDVEGRLEEIASHPLEWNTPWLAAIALYAGFSLKAAWLSKLNGRVQEIQNALVQDAYQDSSSRKGLSQTAVYTLSGGEIMFSIIEKVLILKKASLFSETPDDALAEVAQTLDEQHFAAGQLIFEKNAPGSSMYLIASGKVRVFEGTRTLNYLEESDVFGEMAVLDPAPRSASVEAVEETDLLQIDQAQLYELVESRLEVARGVIQVLSRHLRNRLQDIDRLQNVLERPARA